MTWQHALLGVFFALVMPVGPPRLRPEPLPVGVRRPAGPRADVWTKKSARLTASQVRLSGLGAHTHANWILFRLAFDTTKVDRVRHVRFTVTAAAETDVAALRIGSVCTPVYTYGPIERWPQFTVGGISGTRDFRDHPIAPTADPTIFGVGVPTRVANYVACGGDRLLEDASTWRLDVTWEEI